MLGLSPPWLTQSPVGINPTWDFTKFGSHPGCGALYLERILDATLCVLCVLCRVCDLKHTLSKSCVTSRIQVPGMRTPGTNMLHTYLLEAFRVLQLLGPPGTFWKPFGFRLSWETSIDNIWALHPHVLINPPTRIGFRQCHRPYANYQFHLRPQICSLFSSSKAVLAQMETDARKHAG